MNPFNRLPDSRRTPSGLEWVILRKLPGLLLAGTLICACFWLLLQFSWFDLNPKETLQAQYATIGLMFFEWISIVTIAFGCIIVVIMKGHAYVRDAYPLPDGEQSQFLHSPPAQVLGSAGSRHRKSVRRR